MPSSVKLDDAQIQAVLLGSAGPVLRLLLDRGERVANVAKGLCPVATGQLRSSIHTEVRSLAGVPYVAVGTNLKHGRFVHDGTGIYGPKARPITPTQAKALRFKPRGSSEYIFRRSVSGMRPRPFLRDALRAI